MSLQDKFSVKTQSDYLALLQQSFQDEELHE